MRFNSENAQHLDDLEKTLGTIVNPIDKMHLKGQPHSVPGREAVGAMTKAKEAIESIRTIPDAPNEPLKVDAKQARPQLKIAAAKLQIVERELENLEKDDIGENRMTTWKEQIFESFGRNAQVGLPSTFKRYEEQPVKEIVTNLKVDIQQEI